MYHAAGGHPRSHLNCWFHTAPGKRVAQMEHDYMDEVLPNLFGYHLVQVGRLGERRLMTQSRILHHCLIEIDGGQALQAGSVRAGASSLPLESASVDVLLLPHVLEFEARPHDAVREAARVLVAEGHLLVTAFNPWSWFGVWRAVLGRRGQAPWSGQFFSLSRIKDWLALLGFDLVQVQTRFFRPPFSGEQLLGRLRFLDQKSFARCNPFPGVVIVLAKKRLSTLTPLKTRRWAPRRLVGAGLAGPAARREPPVPTFRKPAA